MRPANFGSLRSASSFIILFITLVTLSSSQQHKHAIRHSRSRLRREHGQPSSSPSNTGIIPKNATFTVQGLEQQVPDQGPWGQWTESSECSRTCGGGVAYQSRICLGDRSGSRSERCVGPRKKYFSCNIQDCPDDGINFRAVQCSRFNTVPFEGKYYSWVPYTRAPNKCELNCMPKGERFYYRHAKNVIDGTRCYDDDRLDVCVEGLCLPVGCDMILGSSAKEDKCRECGGDRTSCKTIAGTFDLDSLRIGYNDILLIPAGATNINIKEVSATNNYLAVRNLTGGYYLNGLWSIDFPRDLRFAGTLFNYERKPHGFRAPESLRALGPLTEPIFIVLLYQESNPGVTYEYSVPKDVAATHEESHTWVYDEFSGCSATCGGGFQARSVSCTKSRSKEPASDYLCDPLLQPAVNRSCNSQPCPASWNVGEWEECSVACGEGLQHRNVYCQQIIHGSVPSVADNSECDGLKKPANTRPCTQNSTCPDWVTGHWAACDRMCGEGQQTRRVACQRYGENNQTETLREEMCDAGDRPSTNKTCLIAPCDGLEWIVSDWTGCDLCGASMESRTARCTNSKGRAFSGNYCDGSRTPDLTRRCNDTIKCEAMWFATQWSECSSKCGRGVQTRQVFCGSWENGTVVKVDETRCNESSKYDASRNCTNDACKSSWFSSPWGRCSSPCGGGNRKRVVVCMGADNVIDQDDCDASSKPITGEPCNSSPCDDDEMMVVGGCKDTDHGCCPDGMTPSGKNYEGCPPIKSNVTCDKTEFGCCFDEVTIALGPFRQGCPNITSCNETKHGCCQDGVLPAKGPAFEGCVTINCTDTLFGCCGDDSTPAEGPDGEGCPVACVNTEYGCCPDGVTVAKTANRTDCPECLNSTYGCCPDGITAAADDTFANCPSSCVNSTFGCCPDGVTPANDANFTDCPDGCVNATFGCCPDGVTTAVDENLSNCLKDDCANSTYGCCSDGITPAKDSNSTDCPDKDDCAGSKFGCCPDGTTPAIDGNLTSCPNHTDCGNSTHGCCSDGVTPAEGPDMLGCFEDGSGYSLCSETSFGCCSDGVTPALGENNAGCDDFVGGNCSNSTFGCCPDGSTAADGPYMDGCESGPCENSTYGCCRDNGTRATGPDFEGCPVDCANATFGCCSDNVTAASGPDSEGCAVDCSDAEFGCCTDNVTVATGAFYEGCENVTECFETDFGCCPDNVTIARGANREGCHCDTYKFGCCPDGVHHALGLRFLGCTCHYLEHGCCQDGYTPADGADYEGCTCDRVLFSCCPDNETPAKGPHYDGCGCHTMHFGCCEDNRTIARGPDYRGCGCETTNYGCCPDQRTPARGENYYGCDCRLSPHGCCPDRRSHASGPDHEGCDCTTLEFGCCQDGKSPAKGPNYRGCDCRATQHGCCPDGRTPARGLDYAGCGCVATEYGCCPDGRTPAQGPDHYGCDCRATQYGCCPDGRTPARGFDYAGCDCRTMRHGCCPDGRTVARGPRYQGCPCDTGPYGCCRDGVTMSPGPNYQGCPDTRQPSQKSAEVCGRGKDRGPCRNFSVQWFFDVEYGGCSRFWYGGCKGNGNVFSTQEECSYVCIDPRGEDACKLPLVKGTCDGDLSVWGYSADSNSCRNFTYGGCLGNNNRFQSRELCERTCVTETKQEINVCEMRAERGSCGERIARFYFDGTDSRCKQFVYTGCGGNENNFESLETCKNRCRPAQVEDLCSLPAVRGTCFDYQERWHYDSAERRCAGFIYGGCKGNKNNFGSKEECESSCARVRPTTVPTAFKTEYCFLDYEIGPCTDSEIYWYYDYKSGICERFYYGGCDGNHNRFRSRAECKRKCGNVQDLCELPKVVGSCSGKFLQWYYDSSSDSCIEFYYSGCKGNKNRFDGMSLCETQCLKRTTPAPTIAPTTTTTAEPTTTAATTVVPFNVTSTTQRPLTIEEICKLSQDTGSCSGSYEQWYFNAFSGKCEPLVFTGCGGNANRFATKENCQTYCERDRETTEPRNETDISNEDVCRQPFDVGPCDKQQDRWYYDSIVQRCLPFKYGGCGGNKNRFKSLETCDRFCSSVKSSKCEGDERCRTIRCPYGIEEHVDIDGCRVCQCFNPCRGYYCESGYRCAIKVERSPSGDFLTSAICRQEVKPGSCPAIDREISSSQTCSRQCNTDADCRQNRKCCADGCSMICEEPDFDGQEVTTTMMTTTPTTTTTEPVIDKEDLKPIIKAAEADHTAKSNDNLTLTCIIVSGGNTQLLVAWFKDAEQITFDDHYVNVALGRMMIVNASVQDTGEYTCLAYNRYGQARAETYVRVTEPDESAVTTTTTTTSRPFEQEEPPMIEPVKDEITVDIGSPITLRCHASGSPRPETAWYKGTVPISNDDDRYKVLTNGMLQISSSVREDADTYRCLAYNTIGQDEIAVKVSVLEEVEVKIEKTPEPYHVGDRVQLDCIISGYPVPRYGWYINSKPVTTVDNLQILDNGTIIMENITTNNTGIYTCLGANQHSQKSAYVDIMVKSKSGDDYPDCTDSPHFADCNRIVDGDFCSNIYYSKYCCRSCYEAGKLDPSQINRET